MIPILEVTALVVLITPPNTAVVEPMVPLVVVKLVVLYILPVISFPVPKLAPPSKLMIELALVNTTIFPKALFPQLKIVVAVELVEHDPLVT
jgi:hypothetical protein